MRSRGVYRPLTRCAGCGIISVSLKYFFMKIDKVVTEDKETLSLGEFDSEEQIDRKVVERIEASPLGPNPLGEINGIIKAEKSKLDRLSREADMAAGQAPNENLRQLSPESVKETLAILRARFISPKSMKLHPDVEWAKVKAALLASPEALWKINVMEERGHQPDVYFSDENGFDVGTCSEEAPWYGRNCVYDEESVKKNKRIWPGREISGSAEAMVKEMGIGLMTPAQYKVLRSKDKFDLESKVWLKAEDVRMREGYAVMGGGSIYRLEGGLWQVNPFQSDEACSWRGSFRVSWVS